MALVIDATVGADTANSFVTLSEAATYMEARLNASLWDAATTDTQNRALVEATRELCGQQWAGTPVTSTQALQWPRQWVANPDAPSWGYAVFYTTTEIPARVKDATCELAFQFVKMGTTDLAALPSTYGLIENTVDVLTKRWADSRAQKLGLERFPRVMDRIRPLVIGGGVTMSVIRG